jgi:hypothetical protein
VIDFIGGCSRTRTCDPLIKSLRRITANQRRFSLSHLCSRLYRSIRCGLGENQLLAEKQCHDPRYRGAWIEDFGCIAIAASTSSGVRSHALKVVRWCLLGIESTESCRRSRFVRAPRPARPDVSSILYYFEPNQGHTGAALAGVLLVAGSDLAAPATAANRPPNPLPAKARSPPRLLQFFLNCDQRPLDWKSETAVAAPTTRSLERRRCRKLLIARNAETSNG